MHNKNIKRKGLIMPTKSTKSVSNKNAKSSKKVNATALSSLSVSNAETIIPTGIFLFMSLLVVILLIVGFVAIF
jgi:hypothetical protein